MERVSKRCVPTTRSAPSKSKAASTGLHWHNQAGRRLVKHGPEECGETSALLNEIAVGGGRTGS